MVQSETENLVDTIPSLKQVYGLHNQALCTHGLLSVKRGQICNENNRVSSDLVTVRSLEITHHLQDPLCEVCPFTKCFLKLRDGWQLSQLEHWVFKNLHLQIKGFMFQSQPAKEERFKGEEAEGSVHQLSHRQMKTPVTKHADPCKTGTCLPVVTSVIPSPSLKSHLAMVLPANASH